MQDIFLCFLQNPKAHEVKTKNHAVAAQLINGVLLIVVSSNII